MRKCKVGEKIVVGTKVKIIDACFGARGCNNTIGLVVNDNIKNMHGVTRDYTIKVKVQENLGSCQWPSKGSVWSINTNDPTIDIDILGGA